MICMLLLAVTSVGSVLGGSARAGKPNILLFFPDEWRYDWGGTHNNPYYNSNSTDTLPLQTPHFDWVARTGTRFTHAWVGAPVCAPSRACLASGRQYDQQQLPQNFHNDYNTSLTTFYSILQRNGYHTMVTGRDDLDKSSDGPGINGTYHTAALGFSDAIRCDGSTDVTQKDVPIEPYGAWLWSQNVSDPAVRARYNVTNCFQLLKKRFAELGHSRPSDRSGPFSPYAIPDPIPLPDVAYQDNWIGRQAMALLQRRPEGKPFFLEVSHQAPHPPMDITHDMMVTVRNRSFPPPFMSTITKPSLVQMGRQNYAAKIERLDYWLGQYIALLQSTDQLSNTLICLASDHGEMLFDRDTTAKSKPWNSASSVPLICSGAALGVLQDAVVTSPVSTVDLAPTFLDFAGILGQAAPGMSTQSLRPVLVGAAAAPARTIVHFGLSNFRGLIFSVNQTHAWKFFCCNNGCPGSTKADGAGFAGTDEFHLFNVLGGGPGAAVGMSSTAIRFEEPSADMRRIYPEVVAALAALLPAAHSTPSNPNSSHPSQGNGYYWKGCQLA